jgi:poly(3-hydroxybutyrate) depolymerase
MLWNYTGLKRYGYIFVPEACEGQSCHIHIHLHDCKDQGDWIVEETQFAEYAVPNNIIMVYPQVSWWRSCWDTYGYTDELFATADGV